jgi:hypothetical protein
VALADRQQEASTGTSRRQAPDSPPRCVDALKGGPRAKTFVVIANLVPTHDDCFPPSVYPPTTHENVFETPLPPMETSFYVYR